MALGERWVCVSVGKARHVLRAWRVARCALRSTRDSEPNARRRRAGAHYVAARRGFRGSACARVMSRRRAMERCGRWRIGRRTTCCVRNVRAHRAVRSRCGRVRVCGAKRALCCVRSVARKVLRAPRVAQGAARSARGPKASARRRRAELPAASRRVGAVWLRGCEVASGSAQCACGAVRRGRPWRCRSVDRGVAWRTRRGSSGRRCADGGLGCGAGGRMVDVRVVGCGVRCGVMREGARGAVACLRAAASAARQRAPSERGERRAGAASAERA